EKIRRLGAAKVSEQIAGLQLFTFIQLETEFGRGVDHEIPARAGGDGLQISIRYVGRISHTELLDVQSGARLCEAWNERIFGAAGSGIRRRGRWLHCHQTPA